MNFFISILGGFIGIILAIIVFIAVIYFKLRASVGAAQMGELKNAFTHAKEIARDEYTRVKSISGLTSMLEPRILRDFPEFNRDLLFSINEKNIRKILNGIEAKDISEIDADPDLIYIEPKVRETIEDMKSNQIDEKFDNIEFNRSAISSYTKDDGKATIKVSTSLGYYYDSNRKDKKSYSDLKKQTRYTTEFVYVYDESKFDEKQLAISVHCKNCGAPITNLGDSHCEYCMAPVERINLRAWKMSSFKEDYNN